MKRIIAVGILVLGVASFAHAGIIRHIAKPAVKASVKGVRVTAKAGAKTVKVAAKVTKAVVY